jgi:hypothetical protein
VQCANVVYFEGSRVSESTAAALSAQHGKRKSASLLAMRFLCCLDLDGIAPDAPHPWLWLVVRDAERLALVTILALMLTLPLANLWRFAPRPLLVFAVEWHGPHLSGNPAHNPAQREAASCLVLCHIAGCAGFIDGCSVDVGGPRARTHAHA